MVKNPSTVDATRNSAKSGANNIAASATVCAVANTKQRVRFANRSPSGSNNRMPSASASWFSAGTSPIVAGPTPKSRATSEMIGWI